MEKRNEISLSKGLPRPLHTCRWREMCRRFDPLVPRPVLEQGKGGGWGGGTQQLSGISFQFALRRQRFRKHRLLPPPPPPTAFPTVAIAFTRVCRSTLWWPLSLCLSGSPPPPPPPRALFNGHIHRRREMRNQCEKVAMTHRRARPGGPLGCKQ